LLEMEDHLEGGEMIEHAQGGLLYHNLTVILGSELEIYDENCQGPVHVLCFLPTVEKMKLFSAWLSRHVKNIHLSSQRTYVSGRGLQEKVKELGGIFIPAHVFTPFKSLFGKGVKKSLTE